MTHDYDLIIVGGGITGSALGRSMAEKGIKTLILEREKTFHDRVRGEYVQPWGVTEAKSLGIYDLLMETCGHEARYRSNQLFGTPTSAPRDMVETTPHHTSSLHFYHPEMQEVLLKAAEEAGTTVIRGGTVREVKPGSFPSVRFLGETSEQNYTARLIICADGRNSVCRKWAGFTVQHDPDRMVLSGVLFEGVHAPDHTVYTFIHSETGECALLIPLGATRFRCYAGYYQQAGRPTLSGERAKETFVSTCISAGAPRDWFSGAETAGPLASFKCADTWVEYPYRDNVILAGDAAASSDPCFGCGLSLALKDAHVIHDLLVRERDWDKAGKFYADEHGHYYGSIHRLTDWMTMLMYEPGPKAAARRARAFARVAEDPRRLPDIAGLGPEAPSDSGAYQNLFGEEI